MKYLSLITLFFISIGSVQSTTITEGDADNSLLYKISGYVILSTQGERITEFSIQDFTSSEIAELNLLIKELPTQLRFLKGIEGLYRLHSNTTYTGFENSAAIARSALTNETGEIKQPGHIVLTDLFFLQSKFIQKLTLIHEFCHQLDYQPLYIGKPPHSSDPSSEFLLISIEGQGYVTNYAKEGGIFEDFAESCAYYFLDPKRLSFRSPKRASYFKKLMEKYSSK